MYKYYKYLSKNIFFGGAKINIEDLFFIIPMHSIPIKHPLISKYTKKLGDEFLLIHFNNEIIKTEFNNYDLFSDMMFYFDINYDMLLQYLIENLNTDKNSNLYLSIAPTTLVDFWLPNFIIETLETQEEEKYTIIIFGFDYKNTDSGFNIDLYNDIILKIYEKYTREKINSFGDRLRIIHIYGYFPVSKSIPMEVITQNFFDNFKSNKKNFCYYGINDCGTLFKSCGKNLLAYDIYTNLDYIFIGCDGLFYKEKKIIYNNHQNLAPTLEQINNLIE